MMFEKEVGQVTLMWNGLLLTTLYLFVGFSGCLPSEFYKYKTDETKIRMTRKTGLSLLASSKGEPAQDLSPRLVQLTDAMQEFRLKRNKVIHAATAVDAQGFIGVDMYKTNDESAALLFAQFKAVRISLENLSEQAVITFNEFAQRLEWSADMIALMPMTEYENG